jgi:hypothetical protein
MDWPKPGEQHGKILRMGSNGWTCIRDEEKVPKGYHTRKFA